jgi:FlaA1/EpsC-like NDP-sugar epimerase
MLGVGLSILAVLFLYRFEGFSRTVFGFDVLMLAMLLVGARVAISLADEYLRQHTSRGRKVLIYGAGRGGRLLARELLQNPDLKLMPVGFLDDDTAKQRLRIDGLRVLGRLSDLPRIAALLVKKSRSEFATYLPNSPTGCRALRGIQDRVADLRFSLRTARRRDRSVLQFPAGRLASRR